MGKKNKSAAATTPAAEKRWFSRPPEFPTLFLFLMPFGLMFVLAGLAPFLAMVPWWNWMEQRSWFQVTATITQTGEQLVYEYDWGGQKYAQSTYSVRDDSETGKSPLKTEFLASHKVGDTVPAYVNPDDPAEAVLNRNFSWQGENSDEKWMMLIFFLVFGIPGLLCVFFGLRAGYRYVRDLMAYRKFVAA